MPSMDAAARKGFVAITDGTNSMPMGDAVARRIFHTHTDGTNSMPAGDAVARAIFHQISDATNGPVAVKASSTIAAATDKALVVRPLVASDGTNSAPTMDAAARKGFVAVTDGTNTAAVKAASTGAALTDPSLVVAISPNCGLSKTTKRDLAGTVQAIKASAGALYAVQVVNNQAATAFIQIFDVAAGSVTLGTTNPDFEFQVPANQSVQIMLYDGLPCGTAISVASTTTEKGASGSAAGVQLFAQFA